MVPSEYSAENQYFRSGFLAVVLVPYLCFGYLYNIDFIFLLLVGTAKLKSDWLYCDLPG